MWSYVAGILIKSLYELFYNKKSKCNFFENLIAINFVIKIWTISEVPLKRGIHKQIKANMESNIRNHEINKRLNLVNIC